MESPLSHVDRSGTARMVNVSSKPPMHRTATAAGRIDLAPGTVELIRNNDVAKGDVLTVARVAGISAAKRTADLIPLCHPLGLDHIDVDCRLDEAGVAIRAEATCVGRTGIEMEVLTAVSVTALTVYDMVKAVDTAMRIGDIHLLSKEKRPL